RDQLAGALGVAPGALEEATDAASRSLFRLWGRPAGIQPAFFRTAWPPLRFLRGARDAPGARCAPEQADGAEFPLRPPGRAAGGRFGRGSARARRRDRPRPRGALARFGLYWPPFRRGRIGSPPRGTHGKGASSLS